MTEVWVINASPLIALAKIGHVDLLMAPERELLLPVAVAREVLAGVKAALAEAFGERAVMRPWLGARAASNAVRPTLMDFLHLPGRRQILLYISAR